jgi:hypothetical protein
MRFEQTSFVVWIPFSNTVIQAAFRERKHFLQPRRISGNLTSNHFAGIFSMAD